MSTKTFLQEVTENLFQQFGTEISNTTLVLPSKRAKVFLVSEIQKQVKQPLFCPEIISIEEFIESISKLRSIDTLETLFEFYEVYKKATEEDQLQDFDTFSFWAKTMLQDFNEIDRYLLEPNHVFSYLKDIEALKRWHLEPNEKTELIDTTFEFWNKLPNYYQEFYNYLKQKGIGYQGMLYREAVAQLDAFSDTITTKFSFVFIGFNALNQAEERIFKHLLIKEKAQVFWDIDASILQDSYNDAGLFIRNYKKNWKWHQGMPFKWSNEYFKEPKNIQIIGTPKSVGQAKIVGTIIENIASHNKELLNTAVILGDENLLLPVLFNLPHQVKQLNVTMGYPSKNNPAQLLLQKIIKMHANAIQRDSKAYTFYFKDVLDVMSHTFVQPYLNAIELEHVIKRNNITFFSNETWFEIFKNHSNNAHESLFELLFSKWDNQPLLVIKRLLEIVLTIKKLLSNETNEEVVSKAFLFTIYEVLNRLETFITKYNTTFSTKSLQAIYKQIIDLAEVSFEGEPLTGLQVMGVLESRVLDFENVIITSVNEGKFPAGKSQNSFIPYDIKRELGLPTYKEKDAIYSYHFYHTLFRAKNVYLLYNSDGEGIDAGEKSRFITQLEIDFANHITKNTIYNPKLPNKAYEPIIIVKTEACIKRLIEIVSKKGFSPSALTTYIRNPILFYSQRVLNIKEVDEVEESIAVNTLGTIIHEALKHLYEPYINKTLIETDIDAMQKLIEIEATKQFKIIYKDGEIKKGKNLLAFEVAKQNIEHLLALEKKAIQDGDAIKILFLEHTIKCELNDMGFNYPIIISGNVDRIELRNGKIRIIDYKSGKVDANSLKINDFIELTKELKNEKIIQLLCYALMFQEKEEFKNYEVEAGIISFKNMKAGFMPFGLGKGRNVVPKTSIDTEILTSFKYELGQLIHEILNPEIPFIEKI